MVKPINFVSSISFWVGAGRVKSSIHVDEKLWRRFKKRVAEEDAEISEPLEELMLDVEKALTRLVGEGEESSISTL